AALGQPQPPVLVREPFDATRSHQHAARVDLVVVQELLKLARHGGADHSTLRGRKRLPKSAGLGKRSRAMSVREQVAEAAEYVAALGAPAPRVGVVLG